MEFLDPVKERLALQGGQVFVRVLLLDDPAEVSLGAGDAHSALLRQRPELLDSYVGDLGRGFAGFSTVLQRQRGLKCRNAYTMNLFSHTDQA